MSHFVKRIGMMDDKHGNQRLGILEGAGRTCPDLLCLIGGDLREIDRELRLRVQARGLIPLYPAIIVFPGGQNDLVTLQMLREPVVRPMLQHERGKGRMVGLFDGEYGFRSRTDGENFLYLKMRRLYKMTAPAYSKEG